ncbi:MAG: MBL fold metallo-hydrolase [Bilophila wadsworthia]
MATASLSSLSGTVRTPVRKLPGNLLRHRFHQGEAVWLHVGPSQRQKLSCLGDEPCTPRGRKYAAGSGWLLSEAFCLYADRDRFKPYEKHHSTVREACETATELGVENLVLWHTEDTRLPERKTLYTAEGRQYFSGNLFVPDDLESIAL